MLRRSKRLAGLLLTLGLASLAHGLNYMYFSDTELMAFNDRVKWWHGDTLLGPIRTNECLAFMQDPHFADDEFVIMGCDTIIWPPPHWPPLPNFILNAPPLPLPVQADWLRAWAFEQGYYFHAGDSLQARVRLGDHTMRIWWTRLGTPFDTSGYEDETLLDSAVVFFDCPRLHVSGFVHSVLILGGGGTIGLEDNLLYGSSDTIRGQPAPDHAERLAIVAEGDVKILNTPANGRENGYNRNPANLDSHSIALNGLFVALNQSFTFENQNDPDSGYVCECLPDDRGTIYLWGGIAQRRRGYVHRSNRTSTGYLKQYRHDEALRFWDIGLFNLPDHEITPAALDFGEVAVGEVVYDTMRVWTPYVPALFDSGRVGAPFLVLPLDDSLRWTQEIVVVFAATEAGTFHDTLRVHDPYYDRWLAIPVTGTAVPPSSAGSSFILHPSSLILSASPNPFNSRTTLAFSLPTAGRVTLEVYDVTGRRVVSLLHERLTAGDHRVALDAAHLPSGVYLASLRFGGEQRVGKLLLLK